MSDILLIPEDTVEELIELVAKISNGTADDSDIARLDSLWEEVLDAERFDH